MSPLTRHHRIISALGRIESLQRHFKVWTLARQLNKI
jgi:hypothetical protein